MIPIVIPLPVSLDYKINDKVNNKRDITVSLSSSDVELNPGSHLKSLTYVKTINDENVSGEFTADKLSPEIRKELENEDVNMKYKKLYIFSPLPSVPDDIDDLFDFVNGQGQEASQNPNEVINIEDKSVEVEKSFESSDYKQIFIPKRSEDNLRYSDSKQIFKDEKDGSDHELDKIHGDAEVIDNKSSLLSIKSQKIKASTSDVKSMNNFSSNSSGSPFNKYIINESKEQYNKNPLSISSSSSEDPVLEKHALKADLKFQSPKEGRVLNKEIKYILLIRKH